MRENCEGSCECPVEDLSGPFHRVAAHAHIRFPVPDFRGPAWKPLPGDHTHCRTRFLSPFSLLAQSNSEEDGTETLSTFTLALVMNLF